MAATENPYAGQGPVLLDIGDDVGAIVVAMPASTEGLEVEVRPAGATAHAADAHSHGDHRHAHGAYPHVGVVGRPNGKSVAYTLIYPAVSEGDYELVPLPHGPVVLTLTVTGGAVTRAIWPGEPDSP